MRQIMSQRWLQIRGDPSIRRFLFRQLRVNSAFDTNMDTVLSKTDHLLRERGIFHAKIHFSSGQVTLWSISDPYNYHVWLKDEFLQRSFASRFDCEQYPINALIPPGQVIDVLNMFRRLRLTDETVYLRSGSLNIINGTIGLNFSCDGSHYVNYRKFLDNGLYACG
ncbi:MAG: hypothetical protein JSU75_11845 [Gammaproteobacteria bacterium]|nr:MAG: hypothetical protein JSU75_11845 [Gammaproteobacteria bacterium]